MKTNYSEIESVNHKKDNYDRSLYEIKKSMNLDVTCLKRLGRWME